MPCPEKSRYYYALESIFLIVPEHMTSWDAFQLAKNAMRNSLAFTFLNIR